MAGLGEVCSHVGAVLFSLMAAVSKQQSTTCTDVACPWIGQGVAQSMKKVEPSEGRKIAFTKAQRGIKGKPKSSIPTSTILPSPTAEECRAFYQKLQQSEEKESIPKKSAILSIVPGHAAQYVPRTLELNIPNSLNKLYHPKNITATHEDLLQKSATVYQELQLTKEQVNTYTPPHFTKVITKTICNICNMYISCVFNTSYPLTI